MRRGRNRGPSRRRPADPHPPGPGAAPPRRTTDAPLTTRGGSCASRDSADAVSTLRPPPTPRSRSGAGPHRRSSYPGARGRIPVGFERSGSDLAELLKRYATDAFRRELVTRFSDARAGSSPSIPYVRLPRTGRRTRPSDSSRPPRTVVFAPSIRRACRALRRPRAGRVGGTPDAL